MNKTKISILVTSAIILVGCSAHQVDRNLHENMEEFAVYKKAVNNEWGLPLDKDISLVEKPENEREKVFVLFELMKQKSADAKTEPMIPDHVRLLDVSFEKNTMTLNLSNELSGVREEETKQLLMKSIVNTMFLNFGREIETVVLNTEGEPAYRGYHLELGHIARLRSTNELYG